MIETIQWRSSIEAFHSSKKSVRNTCQVTCEFVEYEVSCTYHHFPIVWFLCMYYLLNTFFQMCLILSGDIETNPGPSTTKICPSCDAQIHIRKKIRMCGYRFNQNYQNLKIACLCFSYQKLLKSWYVNRTW